MTLRIDRFRLEYDYLSNFYPACVRVDGLEYLSSEAAYQAAKCASLEDRRAFTELGANDAKRMGQKVPLRPDWEQVKVREMEKIVRAKFTQNPQLAQFLVETGEAEILEGNTWHDVFWGIDLKTGEGQNHLGRILMALREDFRRNGLPGPENALPCRSEAGPDGIQVQYRDLTQIPCGCIVNASCAALLENGVDADILRAAGQQLLEECRTLEGCAVTQAKITGGYRLAAKHIIHTLGPRYGQKGDAELLALTYHNVLDLAAAHGIRSIAFPAISTGKFSYPKAKATAIAVGAVRQWLQTHPEHPMEVIFACVDMGIYRGFCEALRG